MMKALQALVVLAAIGIFFAAGCSGGTAGGDTSDAVKQVTDSASKGGATPDPNLPKPVGGGVGAPSGGGAKGGKFRLGTPGG